MSHLFVRRANTAIIQCACIAPWGVSGHALQQCDAADDAHALELEPGVAQVLGHQHVDHVADFGRRHVGATRQAAKDGEYLAQLGVGEQVQIVQIVQHIGHKYY